LIKNFKEIINKELEKRSGKSAYKELFLSMLSSAEYYLSNHNLAITKNVIKSTKRSRRARGLLKLLTKPIKKDDGIESLLELNTPNEILSGAMFEPIRNIALKYLPAMNPSVKRAIKNIYMNFTNYGKKSYESAESVSSKVKGFVKYSMEKYIKVFQFILAMAQPQWNMPWGSKMDFDTNAQSVTPHESVDIESLKQNSAYFSIKYRA